MTHGSVEISSLSLCVNTQHYSEKGSARLPSLLPLP